MLKKSPFGSKSERNIVVFSLVIAAALLLLDQITKAAVVARFTLGEQLTIIPGFFNLTYVTNKGAAWGILAGKGWLLLSISVVVFAVIIWRLRLLTEGWNERYLAMFMILSGIIGNSIDRIWRKEVVDFLDCFIGKHHWPAFNVADSAITVGVTIYVISVLFRPSPEKENDPSESQAAEEK